MPRQARGHGAAYDRARRALLADGPLCHWGCGRAATTADYAIPWSHGGTLDDLVPSCAHCNYGRGAAIVVQLRVDGRELAAEVDRELHRRGLGQ